MKKANVHSHKNTILKCKSLTNIIDHGGIYLTAN